jgi:ABC-type siderophore export system fused ATPase/permease subunit
LETVQALPEGFRLMLHLKKSRMFSVFYFQRTFVSAHDKRHHNTTTMNFTITILSQVSIPFSVGLVWLMFTFCAFATAASLAAYAASLSFITRSNSALIVEFAP